MKFMNPCDILSPKMEWKMDSSKEREDMALRWLLEEFNERRAIMFAFIWIGYEIHRNEFLLFDVSLLCYYKGPSPKLH